VTSLLSPLSSPLTSLLSPLSSPPSSHKNNEIGQYTYLFYSIRTVIAVSRSKFLGRYSSGGRLIWRHMPSLPLSSTLLPPLHPSHESNEIGQYTYLLYSIRTVIAVSRSEFLGAVLIGWKTDLTPHAFVTSLLELQLVAYLLCPLKRRAKIDV
jgi:hypothetical protein